MADNSSRLQLAERIARLGGDLALDYFERRETLQVDMKGPQDWVSEADKNVESLIRKELKREFPDDGIVGEEHAPVTGSSGFTWVIDPIDGTTNFVNGHPAWTVVIAGVAMGRTQIGIIHDPIHHETFTAIKGQGAKLNGETMSASNASSLASGTVGVGYSNRVQASGTIRLVEALNREGAMFHRNASGALSIAYVAAGRLLGYMEEHMNAWDCLAGQLLVAEAGGSIEEQNADQMIKAGGRVVVGAAPVFNRLRAIADDCYSA